MKQVPDHIRHFIRVVKSKVFLGILGILGMLASLPQDF